MWETARGGVTITCDGNSSTVEFGAQSLIAGGTYTDWLHLLNVVRAPGEVVSFGSDVVRIEPLGAASGTGNVLVADASGAVSVSIGHPGCILTQETALVMAVLYHLTGTTYGAAHIPDAEDVTHLLVYVQ